MRDVSFTLRPPRLCPDGHKTWRLYEFEWNTFQNKTRMNNCADLTLGGVLYMSPDHLSCASLASWLVLLSSYDFCFDGVALKPATCVSCVAVLFNRNCNLNINAAGFMLAKNNVFVLFCFLLFFIVFFCLMNLKNNGQNWFVRDPSWRSVLKN